MVASHKTSNLTLPTEVLEVLKKLMESGFEAYAVGGCVRDLLIGRTPEDWDVTTNARPEEIQKIFPDSFYENKFFTVTVKTGSADPILKEIEVTTFREEGRYEDKRHPADIRPAKSLEDDLSRRDFTVNAMALGVEFEVRNPKSETNSKFEIRNSKFSLIDPYGGEKDLVAKLIRAVGNPERRFEEDALRMLRAVRIASQLEFGIEPTTKDAIIQNHPWLRAISKERIRDEFSKIVMSDRDNRSGGEVKFPPHYGALTDTPLEGSRLSRVSGVGGGKAWRGLELLQELKLLKEIVPELEEGIGCGQNKHHTYTVWEHNMRSLDYAAKQGWTLAVRIGALFHDIAKPRAKRGEGPDSTFYGHDVQGGKMAIEILSRLRYPDALIEKVQKLIRWHLFRYDFEGDEVETTDSSIRRLIRNVEVENIEDLVRVRMCDRVGSGVPKAVPYRLRHFQFRVEKVLREHEAVKVTMLQANGEDVMKILGIAPGPKIGHILNALLEEVLDDQKKNDRAYLESRIKDLGNLSDEELVKLREQAEARVELLEDQREQEIKKKYYVK